jgi:hypothetical protein
MIVGNSSIGRSEHSTLSAISMLLLDFNDDLSVLFLGICKAVLLSSLFLLASGFC